MTCTQDYKDKVRTYAKMKNVSVASYLKNALYEQMKRDEKKGR